MELINLTAIEITDLLKTEKISPLECLDSLEKRISQVDNKVNALPILCFERARDHAKKLMERDVNSRGNLFGLPIPIKDLNDVSGVKCTRGSSIYKDNISEDSDYFVKFIEKNGGLIYAKSNTPEFGAGANTFNDIFGATLNPWNTSLSSAGSSGGAAVALATGMAWVAHGNDMGGSLRNPASFCSVVGMRPSPGRVASKVSGITGSILGVEGPMARNIEDLALFFDAMTGSHKKDPISMSKESASFLNFTRSLWKPRKVAFSTDLGLPPVDNEVKEIVKSCATELEKNGVIVEEDHPDLSEAPECFQILRSLSFFVNLNYEYINHKEKLKPEIIWNIEKGINLKVDEIVKAEIQRTTLFNRMQTFFNDYDLLLSPATIVPPFPVEERYLKSCSGYQFDTYIDWLNIVSAISLTCSPALCMPAGFTKNKLPVGVQVIGPLRDEEKLLAGGKFIEDCLNIKNKLPIEPLHYI